MTAVPMQIARWVPGDYRVLGADGFGFADTRPAARRFFQIDAESVVVQTLQALADAGDYRGRRSPRRSPATGSTTPPPSRTWSRRVATRDREAISRRRVWGEGMAHGGRGDGVDPRPGGSTERLRPGPRCRSLDRSDRRPQSSHHRPDRGARVIGRVPPRSGAARDQALPRLRGTVGPGYTITISRNRVPAGRYRVVVTDSSSAHNWRIRGTGVNEHTSVSATGRWGWRVRLRAGAYSILCDPHPSTMRTTLHVTDD